MGASVKIVAAVAALAALLPAGALAAYPGANGKIAFERDGQIWTMNANGTGQVQLTSAAEPSTEPEWSPDGSRIAYTRGSGFPRSVRVMNADGTGDALVYDAKNVFSPTWTPEGSRIGLILTDVAGFQPYVELWDMSPEGTRPRFIYGYPFIGEEYAQDLDQPDWSPRGDEAALAAEEGYVGNDLHKEVAVVTTGRQSSYRSLTNENGEARAPTWSPDGTRLLFGEAPREPGLGTTGPTEIYRINRDGTGRVQLTNDGSEKSQAEWSPDGTKIVFANGDIWTMNPDGSGKAPLVTTAAVERNPDWQPVVGPLSPAAYPRPKYASPVRIPLVPAYQQCASPNETHGPPLAFPSCAPPVPNSSDLTVGTSDANGAGTNMAGSIVLKAIIGNPATRVNEADISITMNVTDVRCTGTAQTTQCFRSNAAGGNDFSGDLTAQLPLRITDRYNLPAPGGRLSGTASDTTLSWRAFCADNMDPAIGSTCTAHTSADAVLGGTVIEGRRSNFELGQAEVLDGLAGQAFLRQGVFVP